MAELDIGDGSKTEGYTSRSTKLAQPRENSISSASLSIGMRVSRKNSRNQMIRLRGTLPFCTCDVRDLARQYLCNCGLPAEESRCIAIGCRSPDRISLF
jgi:hypothetical protein